MKQAVEQIWQFIKAIWRFLTRHGRIWILVIGVLVGMLFNIMPMIMMMMAGFGGGGGGFMNFPTAVEVALVKQKVLDDTVNVAGTLEAEQGAVLRAEVTGLVKALPLPEGAKVEKGQALVILSDSTAAAEARVAERALARLRALKAEDEGLVSIRDMDNAISAKEVADEALRKAHIAAPFAGTVGVRRVNVGDYVSVGQELVSLQAIDTLKVSFNLPERFVTSVEPGQTVNLRIDALGGEVVPATIIAGDPSVDAGSRNVKVQAQVDNSSGKLRPGMFVRVEATLGREDNALVVPEEAIVPEGDAKKVYKVVNGAVNLVPVEIGMRGDGDVQIIGGLKKDDIVVTAGQLKLHEGGKVVATNMTLPSGTTVTPTAPTGTSLMPAVSTARTSGTDVSGTVE